jgi:HlyD family secretion protein
MIRRIREWFLSLTGMLVAIVALSSLLIASYELDTWPWADHRALHSRYEFRTVRRTILAPILSAPGRVESSRRTVLRCEIENIGGTTSNSGIGGSSTLIWLLPEGTPVKKDDVVARFDASTYEEMLRQQTIVVEQAKSSHLQARLDYEIAQLAVREYLEGTVKETVEGMEGAIALARADFSRAQERLGRTQKMNGKGYASVAQIVTDRQTVATLDLALQRQLGSYDLFIRYTLPKTEKTLRSDVTTAQTSLDNEYVRLQRQLERYASLKKQVERCTIRAPFNGILYYYKDPGRRGPNSQNAQIEEGMSVRQSQKLFYLPDLSEMEIQVALNESVVDRISPGLRAQVRFEALPNLVLEGAVASVNPIPVPQNERGEDVRFFLGIVKLDRTGQGLKPDMTARVEIALPVREGVLTVPHRAVVFDQGRKACFLARDDQLVRREVKLGQATTDLVEISEGLTEGEEVALDPPGRTDRPQTLTGFHEVDWAPLADSSRVAASSKSRPPDERSPKPANPRKDRRKGADGNQRPPQRAVPQG